MYSLWQESIMRTERPSGLHKPLHKLDQYELDEIIMGFFDVPGVIRNKVSFFDGPDVIGISTDNHKEAIENPKRKSQTLPQDDPLNK